MTEYVKVTEYVRGVVDGRVVVRRPGARIPVALAVELGIVERPPAAGTPPARPRRPSGATSPRARKRSR